MKSKLTLLATCLLAGLLVVGCRGRNQASNAPRLQWDKMSRAHDTSVPQVVQPAYATNPPPVVHGGPAADEDKPYDPLMEARQTVDGFLSVYRPGLSDSVLPEMLLEVSEVSRILRDVGDKRLVKPLSEIIADTAAHSDNVDAGTIEVLYQIRAESALPVIRQYLGVRSRPVSRLCAATALAVLGEAGVGVPILDEYYRQPAPLTEGTVSSVVTYAFLNSWRAVDLGNPVQESIVSSFFQRICQQASGQTLTNVISYLLQKDDKNRAIAFRRAEEVLKVPIASRDNERFQYGNIEVILERFGGERGRALLSKYQ